MDMMKNNEPGLLKGKAAKVMAAAILLSALGAGAAFAADGKNASVTNTLPIDQVDMTPVAKVEGGLAVEAREDGRTYYSTDDGTTWSLVPPDGVTTSLEGEQGSITISPDQATAEELIAHNIDITDSATESSIAVELREDGQTYYSTDGGQTWSLEIPEGFTVSFDDQAGTFNVSAQ